LLLVFIQCSVQAIEENGVWAYSGAVGAAPQDVIFPQNGEGAPAAWIDGVPAFTDPGASLTADGTDSSDPDGTIVAYDWTLSGPCTAAGSVTDATLDFMIDFDAPVIWPPSPCRLTLTVTDNDGLTGERSFDVVVLPSVHEITMQEAYIAYYGRPADPAGLTYWGVRLHDTNGNLDALIAAYGTSPEYTSRYSGLSDAELINTLYQNMFGRDAEAGGLQWYIDERLNPYREDWINSHGGSSIGATEYALSRIALDILNGALGDDSLIIENKREVAQHFTEQVVRYEVAYEEGDIPGAIAILFLVTADQNRVTVANAEIDRMIVLWKEQDVIPPQPTGIVVSGNGVVVNFSNQLVLVEQVSWNVMVTTLEFPSDINVVDGVNVNVILQPYETIDA
jgi:hypothetical protein